jgi:hypothetical protein
MGYGASDSAGLDTSADTGDGAGRTCASGERLRYCSPQQKAEWSELQVAGYKMSVCWVTHELQVVSQGCFHVLNP